MALRVFGDAALPPVERNAATLARYIKRHKLDTFNARSLRRKAGYTGPKQPKAQEEALELLSECNWIMPAPQRAGENGGRLSADFIVNPAVHL
jgi:putative DNA primase/helicase